MFQSIGQSEHQCGVVIGRYRAKCMMTTDNIRKVQVVCTMELSDRTIVRRNLLKTIKST